MNVCPGLKLKAPPVNDTVAPPATSKVPLLVKPLANVRVPLCTLTSPLLVNPNELIVIVPVPPDLRNVPALLITGVPLATDKLPSNCTSTSPPSRFSSRAPLAPYQYHVAALPLLQITCP